MSNLIIAGVVIGAVVVYRYRKQRDPENIYPAWRGKMTDKNGREYQIHWADFKLIEGVTIYSNGADAHGSYKIRGKLSDEGIANFKLKRNSTQDIVFQGSVTGPNRISGMWHKANLDQGTFEISCESQVYKVVRQREAPNPPVVDYYPIGLSSKKRDMVGIGFNEAGLYRIIGRQTDNQLYMTIIHPKKFVILVYGGRLGADMNSFNAAWQVTNAGRGVCNVYREAMINLNPDTGRRYQPNQGVHFQTPFESPRIQDEHQRLIQESGTLNYPSYREQQANNGLGHAQVPRHQYYQGIRPQYHSNQPHCPAHSRTPFE